MTDQDYMALALDLARKGAGWTSPNPMVGAVLVKQGRIIGQGYHARWGDLHAERAALAACREESRVFRPWQAGLTGEVAMEGADLLSIRMELREVRGDGRPLLSCSGVTWDWKAGAPVPLGMLLPERSRRRQLLEGIRQAGEGELRSGSCLLDPDWKETARRKFRASRFCLRPEGIELFYPQCSLAPAVEGVPSFRVPLAGAAWTAGEGTASET